MVIQLIQDVFWKIILYLFVFLVFLSYFLFYNGKQINLNIIPNVNTEIKLRDLEWTDLNRVGSGLLRPHILSSQVSRATLNGHHMLYSKSLMRNRNDIDAKQN